MEILATVAYGQFRDEGLTTPAGEPRKLLAEYRAIRSAQLAIARERGLTPAARRQLAGSGKQIDLAAGFARLNQESDGAAGAK